MIELPSHLVGASKLVITTENKTLRNPAQGFKSSKRKANTSQRWTLELTTGGLDYKHARELFSLLCMAQGTYGTIAVPNLSPAMSGATSGLVMSQVTQSKIRATFKNAIYPGEFIQFDNHPKVYIVTSISGLVIGVYPDLQLGVTPELQIKVGSAVNFHCELASETSDLAFAINDNELSVFSIDFNEEII